MTCDLLVEDAIIRKRKTAKGHLQSWTLVAESGRVSAGGIFDGMGNCCRTPHQPCSSGPHDVCRCN